MHMHTESCALVHTMMHDAMCMKTQEHTHAHTFKNVHACTRNPSSHPPNFPSIIYLFPFTNTPIPWRGACGRLTGYTPLSLNQSPPPSSLHPSSPSVSHLITARAHVVALAYSEKQNTGIHLAFSNLVLHLSFHYEAFKAEREASLPPPPSFCHQFCLFSCPHPIVEKSSV